MIRVILLFIFIVSILVVLKSRTNANSQLYKKLIFFFIILGFLFIIITSGRFVLPQLLQILKLGIPLITKFIG